MTLNDVRSSGISPPSTRQILNPEIPGSKASSSNDDDSATRPTKHNELRHEAGRRVYNFRCYFCHGYSGDAKTLAASFLNPKPRNFNETSPTKLSRNRMIDAVTHGKVGTAMKGFSKTLSADEISLVVDFVRKEFMVNQARNTFYHTKANGWENHQRYKDAFPFATGEIPLDAPDASLSASEIKGRALFMASCVTCHDRARVNDEGALWNAYAVSFPRNQYSHKEGKASEGLTSVGNVSDVDTVSAATVYAKHDIAPVIPDLSDEERAGEKLFQSNCAFCHGADGTGKNWIGSFLQPNPRNLTDAIFMNTMSRQRLRQVIRDGLENSTMPAWKNVLSAEQIDNIVSYVNRAFHSLKNP